MGFAVLFVTSNQGIKDGHWEDPGMDSLLSTTSLAAKVRASKTSKASKAREEGKTGSPAGDV